MASTPEPLVPNDPRVQHLYAQIGPHKYYYQLGLPANNATPIGTVLMTHGFPDLAMSWRYQVPYLTALGFRVIVPDMLGYGKTSAPDDFHHYRFKSIARDLRELVAQVAGKETKFISVGHDWGCVIAWRLGMYYPEDVQCIIGVGVPFTQLQTEFQEFDDLIPFFTYQKQYAEGTLEAIVARTPNGVRQWLIASYEGTTANGELVFSPPTGLIEELLDKVDGDTVKLLSPELLDFYTQEFTRSGLHGCTNWYRNRKLNYDDELEFAKQSLAGGFKMKPRSLCVLGDLFPLPESETTRAEPWFEHLETVSSPIGGHWIQTEDPEGFNKYLHDFIASSVPETGLKKAT